ncbi:unnamed protein product [Prunus armeniaca]
MERFFKRKLSTDSSSPSNPGSSNARPIEVDEILANLQADPGLRTRMADYSPNIRDEIRRAYLQKGPCQPRSYKFPQTNQTFSEYENSSWTIKNFRIFTLSPLGHIILDPPLPSVT